MKLKYEAELLKIISITLFAIAKSVKVWNRSQERVLIECLMCVNCMETLVYRGKCDIKNLFSLDYLWKLSNTIIDMDNQPSDNQPNNTPPQNNNPSVVNPPVYDPTEGNQLVSKQPVPEHHYGNPYYTDATIEKIKENTKLRHRDAHGHFAPGAIKHTQPAPADSSQTTTDLFKDAIKIAKSTDQNTLVDVRVNNPLKKIQELLEEIKKKQKAFSFTLKGSLGVAGIVLVLTTFGIFGGNKAFCSKGEQSHIGTIMIQHIAKSPAEPTLLERTSNAWKALWGFESRTQGKNLTLLVTKDQTVIRLKGDFPDLSVVPPSAQFIATGDYDSCSRTLSINNPHAVSVYPNNSTLLTDQ